MLFDAILTRRPPTLLVTGGLVAGVVGVAVLLVPVEGLAQLDPVGVALVLGGNICWAAGSLYARRAPLPRSGLLGTSMEMMAGGVALLAGGLLLGEAGRANVATFSVESLLAVAYLIVFGSIVAFTAYIWLLHHVSVSTVSTHAYVNPIVAVALGAVFLSEPVTPRTILATILIVGAVIAMVSGSPRVVEEPASELEASRQPEHAGTDRAAQEPS